MTKIVILVGKSITRQEIAGFQYINKIMNYIYIYIYIYTVYVKYIDGNLTHTQSEVLSVSSWMYPTEFSFSLT